MSDEYEQVPGTSTPERALVAVDAPFVLVTVVDEEGSTRPLAVLARDQLRALPDRVLADLGAELPSLVIAEPGALEEGDRLLELADLLARLPSVPAVLVGPEVVARGEVARRLSLDLLASDGQLRALPEVPTRRYVCRKCAPPSYRLPRSAGEPPTCQRVWFHGAMELDG